MNKALCVLYGRNENEYKGDTTVRQCAVPHRDIFFNKMSRFFLRILSQCYYNASREIIRIFYVLTTYFATFHHLKMIHVGSFFHLRSCALS